MFLHSLDEYVCDVWSRPLGVLTTAYNLSSVIAERNFTVEAEILFKLG